MIKFFIVTALTFSTLAYADPGETEEVVAISSVPAAITKAFAARYPKLTATRAEKQTKADKSITFELAANLGKDNKVEATFKSDGTFLEEETVVAASTLPTAVTKAFAARYPKAKVSRAEKQVTADGSTTFELAFEGARGKKVEATFKNDGTFVEEE